MRLYNGLPKMFWAEVVNNASYVTNRGPSTSLNCKIPAQVWNDKVIKFSHLKVFGCVLYIHIDSSARSKLDTKLKICFVIWYDDNKFDYRFWLSRARM